MTYKTFLQGSPAYGQTKIISFSIHQEKLPTTGIDGASAVFRMLGTIHARKNLPYPFTENDLLTWLDNGEPSCSLDVACFIWTYTLEDASIHFHEPKDAEIVAIDYLKVIILWYNIPVLYPLHLWFWLSIHGTFKLHILLLQRKAIRWTLQEPWRNCKT